MFGRIKIDIPNNSVPHKDISEAFGSIILYMSLHWHLNNGGYDKQLLILFHGSRTDCTSVSGKASFFIVISLESFTLLYTLAMTSVYLSSRHLLRPNCQNRVLTSQLP